MGSEDVSLKNYFGDARRYADLWNGSVFQGKQVIKAEELQEANPVITKADKEAVLERTRDLIMKQYYDGQRFAVFTVENQTTIDYGMAARVMLQESLEYNKQIREMMRENKKADKEFREQKRKREDRGNKRDKKDRIYQDIGERLYQVRKQDCLHPVVTLIVYWGEKGWVGAKSLHELIDFGGAGSLVEEELKKLVPEYPLHFLDLSKLEHPEYFQTELRPLFELYRRRNSEKDFVEYIEANEAHWQMDDETWYILSQLTNSKELESLVKEKKDDAAEGKSMCKAIEDMRNGAMAAGKAQGIAESIVEFLKEYGEVSDDLSAEIFAQRDLDILRKWHKLAIKVTGVSEFVQKMQDEKFC